MIIPPLKSIFFTVAATLLIVGCGEQQNTSPVGSPPPVTKDAASVLDALKKAAEGGDAKAQLDLAKRFFKGDGVDQNPTTAFGWALKSAENGNAEAMNVVALAYDEGAGVTKDEDKSNSWTKKAAGAGHPEAQLRYARTFGDAYRRPYILGDKDQQPENARQYIEWLEKSARQNNLQAKYLLGMTYLLGATPLLDFQGKEKKVIEPDTEKALPMLKEAADAGYWQAQWALAVLYQSGFGKISTDKAESDKYWKLMTAQTDPDVQGKIGDLYHETNKKYYTAGKNKYQGKDLDFDGTNKVAQEWFQKAAEKDNKSALHELGTMYRDGVGVYKDDQKSLDYFKRSAMAGHYASMGALAFAYLEGKGTIRDYAEAHKWLMKAADEDDKSKWSDVHRVRNALGVLHEYGWGVEKDIVLAYAWYNIAASGDFDKAKQNLARVEKAIKPEELREAQTLSREWRPGKLMTRADAPKSATSPTGGAPGPTSSSSKSMKLASVGTGFYISSTGNILTNNHVVEGCGEIRVPAENNIVGKLVVADQANDLALVKLEVTGKYGVQFLSADDLKQGEEIFVFGFPLDGYLPSAGNITPGIISALAGPGNNSSLVQITAPVQPGNSGGPLLNKKGNVVGVVVGKANAIKIAQVTGDIPQNINFAIAPRTIKSFLDGNRVEYQKKNATFSFDKDSVAIADEARKTSLKIECWK
jgi:TPR repeat protein